MFQFAIDDGGTGNLYRAGKPQQYRMMGLRHNPYVGSFHGKSFLPNSDSSSSGPKQLIMEDSKGNPLVGVFRHSPSNPSKSLGLKSILYQQGTPGPPIFTQLQVSRELKNIPPHNILRSLRQIPTKVFSASSMGSKSPESSDSPQQQAEAEADVPTCSICLAPYADGDELRTFACSHCFHNECVSKWIFHRCLDNADLNSFNCPECRQNHIALSEAGSSRTSLAEGICSLSFLQVGENMAREGGYDFLSDFGSDLPSPYMGSTPASPRFVLHHPCGPGSASGSVGVASACSGESSPAVEEPNTTPGTASHGGIELPKGVSPRRRPPPIPFSPTRRPLPLGNTFVSRMSMLNRNSNRLLGIFPVPEDSHGLVESTTQPAPSQGMNESIFGQSALLSASSLEESTNSTASFDTTAAACSIVCGTPSSEPHIAGSSYSFVTTATADPQPLCASEYSDCGAPLPR